VKNTRAQIKSNGERSLPLLKNIHPLIDADLLYNLRAMGHGDYIALVDRNFPAIAIAQGKPVIQMTGVNVVAAGDAILSLLPLDTFVDHPVKRMNPVDGGTSLPPAQLEFQEMLRGHLTEATAMEAIERFDFYQQASHAFAIVQTGEARAYGCFLVQKGVIFN